MGPNASEIRHAAQDVASAPLIRRWFGTLVCYLRHGDRVFGTYWTSGRSLEAIVPSDGLLDMTVYGRQETWEDSPAGWKPLATSGARADTSSPNGPGSQLDVPTTRASASHGWSCPTRSREAQSRANGYWIGLK
jgi:hypothetical protein